MKEENPFYFEQAVTKHVNGLVTLDDYDQITSTLDINRYPKLASALRLRKAGLPTLPGFIVQDITQQVLDFVTNWGFIDQEKRVSLRFDSPNPEDHKRLMGSNPTIDEFLEMKKIIKPPVIAIVMGANDRFNQYHSVLTYFLDDRLICEIVGPGFDAADITRGSITPHEIFEFNRKDKGTFDCDLGLTDILSHKIVRDEYYQEGRRRRMGVIYSILEKGLGWAVDSCELDTAQTESVEEFLSNRGSEIPLSYIGLDYFRLNNVFSYISQLDRFRSYYEANFGIKLDNRVLSASFLKRYGLIFWDIYGADKYMKR